MEIVLHEISSWVEFYSENFLKIHHKKKQDEYFHPAFSFYD